MSEGHLSQAKKASSIISICVLIAFNVDSSGSWCSFSKTALDCQHSLDLHVPALRLLSLKDRLLFHGAIYANEASWQFILEKGGTQYSLEARLTNRANFDVESYPY